MKLFTQHDVANSICSHDEVGQPWEERWSIDDHFKGLCTMDQVGSPKPVVPPTPEIAPPTEGENFTDWLSDAFQGMGGKTGFVSYAKANPNTVWPLLLKNGLAAFLKEDATKLKTIDDYSDEEIEAMSSNDLKRLLLEAAKKCPHCGEKLEV